MTQDKSEDYGYRLNVEYYGADFPVEVLVARMEREDFIIPEFQREFVWKRTDSSRFIDSLIIGLPTPSIFLAKDKKSSKYIVIDGQQRLRTLQYFYRGYYPDEKKFHLEGATPQINGLTYQELPPYERRNLDNAIIHCVIISEDYDSRGMFHVFERLNTSGVSLKPQEIRNALYHGSTINLIKELSSNELWSTMSGHTSSSNSQEIILRGFALLQNKEAYMGSTEDFLNYFLTQNQDLGEVELSGMRTLFSNAINKAFECLGEKAFYRGSRFNASLFESLFVIISQKYDDLDCKSLTAFRDNLFLDGEIWNLRNPVKKVEYVKNIYKSII
ncbi:DUF262 domain-containing protein [bacterium]|nr:MAG: DUF262 domain-containing protein [bacterium]